MLYTQTVRPQNLATSVIDFKPAMKLRISPFHKEMLHRSIITYEIPSERIRALIPEEFDLGETTLLTIESFLDMGTNNFEQTNYRFQVSLEGKLCTWLLGTSVGLLSGVTARHLYPLPWHLSAMELQVAIDPATDRYKQYRLSTQSQWASAHWEITDTGIPLIPHHAPEITDYFVRRDGEIGSYQTIHQSAFATKGQLKSVRCDLLTSLGILSAEELQNPLNVSLQRAVNCELKPAVNTRPMLMAA